MQEVFKKAAWPIDKVVIRAAGGWLAILIVAAILRFAEHRELAVTAIWVAVGAVGLVLVFAALRQEPSRRANFALLIFSLWLTFYFGELLA